MGTEPEHVVEISRRLEAGPEIRGDVVAGRLRQGRGEELLLDARGDRDGIRHEVLLALKLRVLAEAPLEFHTLSHLHGEEARERIERMERGPRVVPLEIAP